MRADPVGEIVEPARRRSFSRNVAITYGTQLGAAVLQFLNILVVARTLGPTGRGEVALLTTIAILTSSIATLGVEQANVNLASTAPHIRRRLATNSLVLGLAFGALAAGLVAVLMLAVPSIAGSTPAGIRWATLCVIPVLVLAIDLQLLLQAEYRFGLTNVTFLLTPLVTLIVSVSLAAIGELTVELVMLTWIWGHIATTIILVWAVARLSAGFGAGDPHLARQTVVFGVKSHAGRVMTLANYRLDQWILAPLSGTREVGLYSVAVAWSEALLFLPTALAAVQRPDLARESEESAAGQAVAVLRACIVVTLPLAIVMVAAAPFLCVAVFGEAFSGSVGDLRVLAFSGFGVIVLKLLGNALVAQGRPLRSTAGVAVAFVVTVALDIALIPRFGGLGAAIASTAAYSAGGVAMAILFARAMRVPLISLVPRPGDVKVLWRRVRALARREA